jgi:hypothetical protein
MQMADQKMPFLDLALFLLSQLSEYLSQMPPEIPIQQLCCAGTSE